MKWIEPALPNLMGLTAKDFSGGLLPIEKALKNWGLAPQEWSLSNDILSIASMGGSRMITPFVTSFISRVPDASIPQMAHSIVDGGIKNGSLTLFGRLTFNKADLEELKKYLDCNLPLPEQEEYEVKIPVDLSREQEQKPEENAVASPNARPNVGGIVSRSR